MRRTCWLLAVLALVLLTATAAVAGLTALSYTTPNDEAATVGPNQQWINPAGDVTLYISGGLERKVGYLLQDSQGSPVAEGTSGLISSSDVFTVLGQTYYGKVLVASTVLAEGAYTLWTFLYDSQGSLLSTEQHNIRVDKTPPTTSGVIWWRSTTTPSVNRAVMNNDLVPGYYTFEIWVPMVLDDNGVQSVLFETYDPATQQILTSKAAVYDSAAKKATVAHDGSWPTAGSVLPPRDGPLGVRFTIQDRAGNQAVVSTVVRYDGARAVPELVAVWNPNVTTEYIPGSGLVGFEPYTPNMTAYSNPVKLLYRLPRAHWVGDNPDYGQAASVGAPSYVDADYAYFIYTVPHAYPGGFNSSYRFYNPNYPAGSGVALPTYYLVLSETVAASPKPVAWQWYVDGLGWQPEAAGSQTIYKHEAFPITQMRFVVEARSYDQVAKLGGYFSCTIPAGQTECTATGSVPSPTAGQITGYYDYFQLSSADNQLYLTSPWLFWMMYDLAPPTITSYAMDAESKTIVMEVNKYTPAGYYEPHTKLFGGLSALDLNTNQETAITGAVTRLGGNNYRVVVNYSSLPDGNYQLTLRAWDEADNLTEQSLGQLALDMTGPTVAVFKEAQPLADHGEVTSLGQIRITLSDNVDQNPQVTDVRLEGGPQNQVIGLAYHMENAAYVLEYPVLFPSMGQEYFLVVVARDASGNVTTKTTPFSYAPPQMPIASLGQQDLNLPAMPRDVMHADGSNALRSDVIKLGGTPIAGTYDLIVMSQTSSEIPVVVNGLTVQPGEQKTIPAYNFAATGGRLDLPLGADTAGRAVILITSTAPNFPVLTANINFWRVGIQMTATPDWAVQPVIQKQRLSLIKEGSTLCRLTGNEQEARTADPINDPVCLVRWSGLPATYKTEANYAEGVLPVEGDYTAAYEIYIYNAGQAYLAASGSQALSRAPMQDLVLSGTVSPAAEQYYRQVQEVTVKVRSSGQGYRCPSIVASVAEAQQKSVNEVVCLLRWGATPEGLQAVEGAGDAVLRGRLAQLGNQEISWQVDLYSPYGVIENAATGSMTLAVVDPPLPELTFEPGVYGEKINDDLYATSELQGGEVGSVKFGAGLNQTNLTLEIEGVEEGSLSRTYWSASSITFSRYLRVGRLGVWQSRDVNVRLYYTDLPELKQEKRLTVVGVPPKRVQALLTAPKETTDTTGVPVRLAVGLPAANNQVSYDSGRDGVWRARFGRLDRQNAFQPLTDYQPVTGGVLETTLTGFNVGYEKLVAEVELTPPEGYEYYGRTLRSNAIYTVVLKGTAPEGRIYSRSLTGPAPLTAVMSLQVPSETLRVMGAVVWQMSSDGGGTWQNITVKSPYQASVTVPAGRYLVRAQMTNQMSGAVGYTEAVELNAYEVPQLALTAPAAVIVGTPVTLRAQVMLNGEPVAAEDAVVEWYNRSREKVFTGAEYALTPESTESLLYQVRARLAAAPESDAGAWVRGNVYVRVVPPSPPRGLIAAPSYMEYNTVSAKSYELKANLYLAMGLDPQMYPIRGEWRLPNGETVAGLTLTYSPTAADAAKRQALFEHVSWIEGFREQTQTITRRSVVVGTYAWPEFRVDVKAAPEVAPSLVTLTAAPLTGTPGDLEKPTYQWRLPSGATLVREQDRGRVVQVNFPAAGSYEVGVTVTDARGATGEATATVALGEPAPFVVEFAPLYSNNLMRETLDVTLRTKVTGGHPQDRLVTYEFSVNSQDAQVTSFPGSGVIKGLKAGDYTAHLRAVSKLGKVVEADYPISVIANQLPSCQVNAWESGGYRWWKAACQDADGRVTGYRWYLDDKLLSSGQTIRMKESDITGALRFEAKDDAGGTYVLDLN